MWFPSASKTWCLYTHLTTHDRCRPHTNSTCELHGPTVVAKTEIVTFPPATVATQWGVLELKWGEGGRGALLLHFSLYFLARTAACVWCTLIPVWGRTVEVVRPALINGA